MGKYSKYQKQPKYSKPVSHPIWRGIGCLMAIILPVLSYLGAIEFVKTGLVKGWPIPIGLLGFIRFPAWVWKVPILAEIFNPLATFRNAYAILVFTIVFLILSSGVLSLLYSILYRIVGPPVLSPVDAPPIKNRKVRKSR
jgi:quinol-cytochrome oxidoreductase complex cytochrome b subunit